MGKDVGVIGGEHGGDPRVDVVFPFLTVVEAT